MAMRGKGREPALARVIGFLHQAATDSSDLLAGLDCSGLVFDSNAGVPAAACFSATAGVVASNGFSLGTGLAGVATAAEAGAVAADGSAGADISVMIAGA